MNEPSFYRAFEDRFRGPRELITERLRIYLPFIEPLKSFIDEPIILDLGCGRGEWLELTQDQGFTACGVDLDEGMLAAARERHLDVELKEGVSALKEKPTESLAVVSGFHIAEHLPFDVLQSLVTESLRVLKPGGLLILETPNPENIVVGAHRFHLDPTHTHPLPPDLLGFLPEYAGFYRTKIVRLQENARGGSQHAANLLEVLIGVSPDYAVVAQKYEVPEVLSRFDFVFSKDFGVSFESAVDRFYKEVLDVDARVRDAEEKAEHAETQVLEIEKSLVEHHASLLKYFGVSFESAVERFYKEVLDVDARVRDAEEKAQHAETRVFEIEDYLIGVYASRSWKITAPLRWFSRHFFLLRDKGFCARLGALIKKLTHIVLRRSVRFLQLRPSLRSRLANLVRLVGLEQALRRLYWRFSAESSLRREPEDIDGPDELASMTPRARYFFSKLKKTAGTKPEKN